MMPRQLDRWARGHFNLSYNQWATLLAVVVGYRCYREPLVGEFIARVVNTCELRSANRALLQLEALGLVKRAGIFRTAPDMPESHEVLWKPTALGLRKIPHHAPRPLAKAGESIRDEERKAG